MAQWRWQLPLPVGVLILLAPAAIILAAIAIAHGLGVPAGEWNDPGQIYLFIPVFLYVVVLGGPLGEEYGWRGFCSPAPSAAHPSHRSDNSPRPHMGFVASSLVRDRGNRPAADTLPDVPGPDHVDLGDLWMAVEQDEQPSGSDRPPCRHQHHGRVAVPSINLTESGRDRISVLLGPIDCEG